MKRISLISCLMFLFAAPLIADCSMADKNALEAFDRAWGDASTRGDRAALEQIYASDYMNLAPGDTARRAEAIEDTIRNAEKARTTPAPPAIHDYYIVNCTPSTATITHRNTTTETLDGKSHTSYSRSIHVLEKRNGKWQVVSNAGHPLSDEGAIAYLGREWNDAYLKGDASWLERNFARDFSNISLSGRLTGKSEELADFKSQKTVTQSAEGRDLNIRREGDTVVVTGVNHVTGKEADGKAFDLKFAFTDVWVKRDGRWQVLATQSTEVK